MHQGSDCTTKTNNLPEAEVLNVKEENNVSSRLRCKVGGNTAQTTPVCLLKPSDSLVIFSDPVPAFPREVSASSVLNSPQSFYCTNGPCC